MYAKGEGEWEGNWWWFRWMIVVMIVGMRKSRGDNEDRPRTVCRCRTEQGGRGIDAPACMD